MAEINPAGATVLQAAKKHIAESKLVSVDVPEWPDADGKPTRIWYRSTVTLAETFDITNYKPDGDERYRHAYAVIRRALDADGKPLFTVAGDEEALLTLDGHVMMRLSGQLTTRPKVADAKKD